MISKAKIELASGGGIELYGMALIKKTICIVTSEFNFDMLSTDARDAAFIDFFTGDEHRFKVLVKNFDDDSVI
jgi:hypothetical protein